MVQTIEEVFKFHKDPDSKKAMDKCIKKLNKNQNTLVFKFKVQVDDRHWIIRRRIKEF